MMRGRIDVHGHFLPGVDDGCADVADSLECARALVSAGYTHAFCTPHVWLSLPGNTVQSIRRWVSILQARFDEAAVPLRLAPGGEINLLTVWPALRDVPRDQLVTYGLRGRHLLFDFWADSIEECIGDLEPAVRHLQALGIQPILAHPERVKAFQSDPPAVDRFTDMGVLLQMNSYCLADPPRSPTHRLAERLLREGRYFLIGTDCHNAAGMPHRLRGLHAAVEMVGEAEVDRLTMVNPTTLWPEDDTGVDLPDGPE